MCVDCLPLLSALKIIFTFIFRFLLLTNSFYDSGTFFLVIILVVRILHDKCAEDEKDSTYCTYVSGCFGSRIR